MKTIEFGLKLIATGFFVTFLDLIIGIFLMYVGLVIVVLDIGFSFLKEIFVEGGEKL